MTNKRPHPSDARLAFQQGLTLIELMVALVIGLIMVLSVFSVLAVAEGRKRSMTTTNDISQSGTYAMSLVDKMIRSAGSGFRAASGVYGCQIFATRSTSRVLPVPAATGLPAPFASVNTGGSSGADVAFRLAPVLILPNQTTPGASGSTSDVLVIMAGTSGTGDMPAVFNEDTPITAGALPVTNSVGFAGNDIVLVADTNAPTRPTQVGNCMIEQITSSFAGGAATSIPVSGTYTGSTIGTANLTDVSTKGLVINLGNVANSNPPRFQLIGVGDNNTLFSYDLLNTGGNSPLTSDAMAEGVFEMHALYGVDTDNSGTISDTEWVSPTNAAYSVASLMAGTPAAVDLLKQIKAIRIGLIMRTQLSEKDAVTTAIPPMFSGVTDASGNSLTYTRALTSGETKFRYRVIESTIPVRNNLL